MTSNRIELPVIIYVTPNWLYMQDIDKLIFWLDNNAGQDRWKFNSQSPYINYNGPAILSLSFEDEEIAIAFKLRFGSE